MSSASSLIRVLSSSSHANASFHGARAPEQATIGRRTARGARRPTNTKRRRRCQYTDSSGRQRKVEAQCSALDARMRSTSEREMQSRLCACTPTPRAADLSHFYRSWELLARCPAPNNSNIVRLPQPSPRAPPIPGVQPEQQQHCAIVAAVTAVLVSHGLYRCTSAVSAADASPTVTI